MTVKMILSGNLFEIKESIKQVGFRWNPMGKNWYNEVEDLDAGVEKVENMSGVLTPQGVRAVAQNVQNTRILWWKDFGRVRAGHGNSGEEGAEVAAPLRERPTPRRRYDSNTFTPPTRPANGETVLSPSTVRDVNITWENGQVAEGTVEIVEGTTVVTTVNPAHPIGRYMAEMGITNINQFVGRGGRSEELIVEIPQWLSINLNCARKLRGYFVEAGTREVEIRGQMCNVPSYHFVGHNAIGGTDRCHRCLRELTHPVSLVVGYGQECCSRIGISRRVDMNDLNNVEVMDRMIRETAVDVWLPQRAVHARPAQD